MYSPSGFPYPSAEFLPSSRLISNCFKFKVNKTATLRWESSSWIYLTLPLPPPAPNSIVWVSLGEKKIIREPIQNLILQEETSYKASCFDTLKIQHLPLHSLPLGHHPPPPPPSLHPSSLFQAFSGIC